MGTLNTNAAKSALKKEHQTGGKEGHSHAINSPGTLTKKESTRPAAVPPRVNSSGRIRSSRSVQNRTTMVASKIVHFTAARLQPYFARVNANKTAVVISTTG